MPPANSTLTTDSAPAHSTTEESANAIDGHSANPAEDPVQDTTNATDATEPTYWKFCPMTIQPLLTWNSMATLQRHSHLQQCPLIQH